MSRAKFYFKEVNPPKMGFISSISGSDCQIGPRRGALESPLKGLFSAEKVDFEANELIEIKALENREKGKKSVINFSQTVLGGWPGQAIIRGLNLGLSCCHSTTSRSQCPAYRRWSRQFRKGPVEQKSTLPRSKCCFRAYPINAVCAQLLGIRRIVTDRQILLPSIRVDRSNCVRVAP
jgi:hypothetical protein